MIHSLLSGCNAFLFFDGIWAHALDPKILKCETFGLWPNHASKDFSIWLICGMKFSEYFQHNWNPYPISWDLYPLPQSCMWPSLWEPYFSSLPHHFDVVCRGPNVAFGCHIPHKSVDRKTPYEAWFGHKTNISHSRSFGSMAWARIPSKKRKDLQPQIKGCIMVGYDEFAKG